MSYIYKTGRIELREQIKKYSYYIKGDVLDVGAGNYSRYVDLFNYDKYARMNVRPGGNTDVVGRVENIPCSNNSFDSIVCTQVLGDVYELHKAFSELYRVLKPGGILLVTESLFDPLHDEPHDFWRFTEHSFKRLAEDAGLKVLVIEKRGGYFSVLAQLKARYWIERLGAGKKWLDKPLSFTLKICGIWARFLDRKDKSRANKLFTHGYILIARKHA
ncbi:MAG: hypothetical protein A3C70_01520 [Candidatus Zambryskibacteria bacterium RIFCSPHIGHO2_02_FULL_43_14]|uniref:Methyltransferase type 11 domain-containing protein n=1 Tax=Candidatus Zambryskibacteria bacterium RIFCSPHIGHO2_02_FULL_43_14 TaxID=1802748 RepID=A0A1G2TFX6_9BACT|nr:MAG: hypothetical protein A2829_03415 [Candidatus Zambryskibacteria bacterium RIFCSPHIGHO2_01_FULL_43_60]OHA96186.1 MAG: hypothetical protein A3C70_01520 [Candidatus Zambryskibacteria bacterium RIFCSPHIGHO2_02_FULL_43_14]OHB03837.1 MAG: hypothetical protein A3B03_03520 [Candidatus Zambryskibacteria bacterium RIFCSPLOWO2_01_FULL_42_41]